MRGPLGDFRISRGWLGVAGGPVFGTGTFSFTPEAGVVAERLRRFDASPATGVSATPGGSLYRVGGALSLRLRRSLLGPLSAELVTGAALSYAPDDVAGMAAGIARVLDDSALRADLVAKGRARAAEFTWHRAAEETLAVYRRAV